MADEGATGGKGCERSRTCWSESERFHSGMSGGRVRDGDGDLILRSEPLLDNSVKDVDEDPINGGLDEGVVVETGTTGFQDNVLLNGKEMFSNEVLKILEMSFEEN